MDSTAPHAEEAGRRVVLLSPSGPFTLDLLAGLKARGITADVLAPPLPPVHAGAVAVAAEGASASARGHGR